MTDRILMMNGHEGPASSLSGHRIHPRLFLAAPNQNKCCSHSLGRLSAAVR